MLLTNEKLNWTSVFFGHNRVIKLDAYIAQQTLKVRNEFGL